jgi:predicted membrane metal-binding protein
MVTGVFGAVPVAGTIINILAVPFFSLLIPLAFFLAIPTLAGIPGKGPHGGRRGYLLYLGRHRGQGNLLATMGGFPFMGARLFRDDPDVLPASCRNRFQEVTRRCFCGIYCHIPDFALERSLV